MKSTLKPLVMMLLMSLLNCGALNAGTVALVDGELSWTGEPTSDGDATWPATLMIDFGDDFATADVGLTSSAYSGSFVTADDGMTTLTTRFFGNDQVDLALEMNPLADLSEETLTDVTNVQFTWAHPDFNDVAPVSFLAMEGPIGEIIPEPTSLSLIGLAALGMIGMRRRKQHVA